MSKWYLQTADEQVVGPYTIPELKQRLAEPDVPREAVVHLAGSNEWVHWTEVPELAEGSAASALVRQPPLEVAPATAAARPRANLTPWTWALGAVAIAALVTPGFIATNKARVLEKELAAARDQSGALAERVAALEAAGVAGVEGDAARDKADAARDEKLGSLRDIMLAIGELTEGIGFFRPAWEYRGIPGASSLDVKARPNKERSGCRLSGNFQFRSLDGFPRAAKARLIDDDGGQLFETTLDLSKGMFAFDAPIACDAFRKLDLAP
ncbi:MAG: DUF4339 domain-containing protein [Polyangiaceae bacterium]|nr:DUF4339 domain-containing protein [Polyangiaceae bacterium]